MAEIKGLHHVSSVVKQAQENIDFYTNVLGMRLLKQTLNYDDDMVFHFYFGNHDGSTGLSTYFPMSDSKEGSVGGGQVSSVRYAIPEGSMAFWKQQLDSYGVFNYTYERFGEKVLAFQDPHGLELELVESANGPASEWSFNKVPAIEGIKGADSAILHSRNIPKTLRLLTDTFGYEVVAEDDEFYQLVLNERLGSKLYLNKLTVDPGEAGSGTVHHIAFEVANDEIESWREIIEGLGYYVTPIRERHYFRSLYFRESGGILIELATSGPGVTVDETVEELGQKLIIPEHYKDDEEVLREAAMPLFMQELDALRTYNYRNRAEYEIATKRETLLEEINEFARRKKENKLTTAEEEKLTELRKEFLHVSRKGV